MHCPNCENDIELDYCYSCGYTVNNYNYLAERTYMEKAYMNDRNRINALSAIKRIYKNISVEGNIVNFSIHYIDADRNSIRTNISKINKKYSTKFDYKIVNRKFY